MAKITKIMLRDQTEKKNSQNDHIEQNQLKNRQIAKNTKQTKQKKCPERLYQLK